MADTPDLGSGAARCAGSTPAPSTLFTRGQSTRLADLGKSGPMSNLLNRLLSKIKTLGRKREKTRNSTEA
jgi:hypothetical protein